MKRMKRTLSVLLSTMLVMVSVCLPLSITASAWEARTNEVDLRLGLLNDTHITKTGSGDALNITALTTLKTLGMEKLAFVGDNVYYTTATDDPSTDREGYNKLWNGLTTAGWEKADVLAFAMGNHEFPQDSQNDATTSAKAIERFETEYGPRNQHVEYKDFHMITGGPETYANGHSRAMEKYYMEEIDKALCEDSTNETEARTTVYDNETADDTSDDTLAVVYEGGTPNSTKPIFLFLHQPIKGTVAGQTGSHYSDEFVNFLAARPQVIFITAHKHLLAQHPDIINQDAGFTAFQSPMTAGGYQSQWGYTKESEINDTMCSQGSFLEVKDNVVYLYRIDYKNGTYIGEPFVVDIPAIVADRLTADTTDDYNHMPYTTAARSAVTSTAAFPEGAAVTATVSEKAVTVTFPNTATMTSYDEVQQDDFIRGYKVEAVSNGAVVAKSEFQADFWKLPENRAASYTKVLALPAYGTEYTINVYPRMPFGAYGTPISTTCATEERALDSDAIRYEFEDGFVKTPSIIQDCDLASGGKMLYTAYETTYIKGGKYLKPTEHPGDGVLETYTDSFTITVPYTDSYDIHTAMGNNKGDWVSKVEILIGDDVVATSGTTIHTDLSLSSEKPYPYSNTPMALFETKNYQLEAGKEYTVTLRATEPKANTVLNDEGEQTNNQPFLFALDYIELIPKTAIIDLEAIERIEIENYIDGVTVESVKDQDTEDTTDDTYMTQSAKANKSSRASGGAYAALDTAGGGDGYDGYESTVDYVDFLVPINVEEEGYYEMEYVTCQLPRPSIYLDSAEGTKLNASVTTTEDKLKNESGSYSYFASSWATAVIDTAKQVYLPKGAHTIIIREPKRGAGDIAQYFDYIQFTPATDRVSLTDALHYEAEDYKSKFHSDSFIGVHPLASGGKYVYKGSGEAISLSFPFAAAEAGKYQLELSAAAGGAMSDITVAMDDGEAKLLTSSAAVKTVFKESHYTLAVRRYSFDLTAGLHELKINIPIRSAVYGSNTAYAFDYIRISKPTTETISQTGATRIEFEKYASADVKSLTSASGGKYVYNNYGHNNTTVKASVSVLESGYYNVEYLFGNKSLYTGGSDNVTDLEMYLGDKLIGKNDATHSENLKTDAGFSWSTAPMCRYLKKNIWIDAGVYDLEVIINPNANNKVQNYQMDYVEFRPVDDIVVGTNSLTAHINSDVAMTGTVILATYNGNELGKVVTTTVNNATFKSITAEYKNADKTKPTHVKVFVIDNYDNVTPLVVHQKADIQ